MQSNKITFKLSNDRAELLSKILGNDFTLNKITLDIIYDHFINNEDATYVLNHKDGITYKLSYNKHKDNIKVVIDNNNEESNNSYPEDNEFKIIKGKEDKLRRIYYKYSRQFTTKIGKLILLDKDLIENVRKQYHNSKYYRNQRLFAVTVNKNRIIPTNKHDKYLHPSMFIPDNLKDNIVIAGGSITNKIIGIPHSDDMDIDVFIVSENPVSVVRKYAGWLMSNSNFKYESMIINSRVINLFGRINCKTVKIQIILRDFKSVEEVVIRFDLDASCCCFYRDNYYCTQRCLLALNTRTNYIDVDKIALSYCYRLTKYAKNKGFYVYQPNFNREYCDYLQYIPNKHYNLNYLLVLEDKTNRSIPIDENYKSGYEKSGYEKSGYEKSGYEKSGYNEIFYKEYNKDCKLSKLELQEIVGKSKFTTFNQKRYNSDYNPDSFFEIIKTEWIIDNN